MIVGFSTKFPKGKGNLSGKKTMFPEKIWKGILLKLDKEMKALGESFENYRLNKFYHIDGRYNGTPKLHTMRGDEKNRWKVGMKIHFNIGVRTKNMFRFAPILTVKSIQKVQIKFIPTNNGMYIDGISVYVYVDDRKLSGNEIKKLAINDGFDSLEDFFEWFNQDFNGKIIHWTNLKY